MLLGTSRGCSATQGLWARPASLPVDLRNGSGMAPSEGQPQGSPCCGRNTDQIRETGSRDCRGVSELQTLAANVFVKNHHVGQVKQPGSPCWPVSCLCTAFGFILCHFVYRWGNSVPERLRDMPWATGLDRRSPGLGSGGPLWSFCLTSLLFPRLGRTLGLEPAPCGET